MDKLAKLEQLKKVLTKGQMLEKTGHLGLAKEFISIDSKIDTVKESVANISEELKKKVIPRLEEELSYEVDEGKIAENVLSKVKIPDPIKGDDGKNYILTAKDKKEIASSIKVPIVEKVIEKTEVIHETPIITNEIKEVAIPVEGEEIVDKINELPTDDEKLKIDAKHIKNLPRNETIFRGGGISQVYHDTTLTGNGSQSDPLSIQNALDLKADKCFAIAMAVAL